jgi:tetratricopeptide (TPR) repeat protein/predicted Ser/Thr protein kinase
MKPLGAGGFARVFAIQWHGREAALKIARQRGDPRLVREAEVLARLESEYVPALLSSGTLPSGEPYLVLERLEGVGLDAWMSNLPGSGAAPHERAMELLEKLARAVDAMNRKGVVHRDLKPENVFLRAPAQVVLLDFGLARITEIETATSASASSSAKASATEALTSTGMRLGTVHYMAPEQCLEKADVDARADLYALAVIAFELFTGRPPFVGPESAVVQAQAAQRPPLISSLAAVSSAVDEVFARALAKDRWRRFDSGQAFVTELSQALRSTPREKATPAPSEPPASERLRVAVLGVSTRAPADQVIAAVEREKGQLARVIGERYVVVFANAGAVRAGLAAAQRLFRTLSAWPGSAALHVAEVRRRGARGRFSGAALEQTDSWWPALEPGQIWSSAEALSEAGSDALSQPERVSGVIVPALPLVGRDALCSELLAEARAAFEQRRPRLSSLVGDAGLGKSRVLSHLAERLSNDATVLHLVSPSPERAEPEAVLRELLEKARSKLSQREEHAFPSGNVVGRPGSIRSGEARAVADALQAVARERPLAVLLDDGHWAAPTVLDALELATLNELELPIWVLVASFKPPWERRPRWGDRAGAQSRHRIEPLSLEASRQLLLALLGELEFVPEAALRLLAERAQGVPVQLVELVRSLRRSRALRAPVVGASQLATEQLRSLSATPVAERLAVESMSSLPTTLRPLMGLAAVLGDRFDADQALAVEVAAGPALRGAIDVDAGLERLAQLGLLHRQPGRSYAFPSRLVREALETFLPDEERKAWHRAALAALMANVERGAVLSRPEQLRRARHAEGCGDRTQALRAHTELAELARREHRVVEADDHYTAALALLNPDETSLALSLRSGRGSVRYRLQRFAEALEDLREAEQLAALAGDVASRVHLLFEQATVLDWLEDFDRSAARMEEASALLTGIDDPALELRHRLARGRTLFRRERWSEAAALLAQVCDEKEVEHEVRAIALVLLAFALTRLDQLDAASARFEQVIELCRGAGDLLHLGIAHSNRFSLWAKRGSEEAGLDDLREAVRLARELGYAQIERYASFNLALILHRLGRDEQARPLAERALSLGLRYFADHPNPWDALLVAQIAWARMDRRGVEQQLEWIDAHCPRGSLDPHTRTMRDYVALLRDELVGPSPGRSSWLQLLERARSLQIGDDLHELHFSAALAAVRRGNPDDARFFLEQARVAVGHHAAWLTRVDALRSSLEAVRL